jgi:hypothetical protein
MPLQPMLVGVVGEQQGASEPQGIDAESRPLLPRAADGHEPLVIEEQVVGLPRSWVLLRGSEVERSAMAEIEARQFRGRSVHASPGLLAWADAVVPWPGGLLTPQLGLDAGGQRAAHRTVASGQQLQVAMGLTSPSRRTTVEKPQPACIRADRCDGPPVGTGEPAGLGLPLLTDQQDVPLLDGVFIQQS